MDISNELLSNVVSFRTYAKYLPHLSRRELFEETVNRAMLMHLDKFPKLSKEIIKSFQKVHEKKIMPSMRALQFSGEAIIKNNIRQYNCSFLNIDNVRCFGETLFLLLSGTGVGFSVQKRHIEQLPAVGLPTEEGIFYVQDSIQGWSQSLDMLIDAYFYRRVRPIFDFSKIRAKGSYLVTTGAKAPGPEPLKTMLAQVEKKLKEAIGRKLKPIEVHDLICIVSDCVLSGGVRRSALISLFDRDDRDMLKAKSGEWWVKHPYRARANNSAVLPRKDVTKDEFLSIFTMSEKSGSGEPGFSWTNDADMGFNPCFSGNSQLLTSEGYKPFSELKNKKITLINYLGEKVEGSVWSNGVKSVVDVKLSTGNTIRCTPNHTFLLNDITEACAKDLKGKKILAFAEENNNVSEFVKLGFLQGDGNLTRVNSLTHQGLEVNIGDKDRDIAELFSIPYEPGVRSYYTVGYNAILEDLKFDLVVLPERKLPKTFYNWSLQQRKDFFRGLYSANGCVIRAGRVAFKGTCFDLIIQMQNFLEELNIKSYITTNKPTKVKFKNGTYLCKQSYDLNISRLEDLKSFSKEIGFVQKYKQENLKTLIRKKSPIVYSVTPAGEEEVFDFNLQDDTHWGVVEGVVAHNCHEIALMSNQFCNLTSINQTGIEDKKDFLSRIHSATLIGTLQAAYTDFPYLRPQWKITTEKEALLGVSFTGIADAQGVITDEWLKEGALLVKEVNERYAKILNINPAARTTAVKPEGTCSTVLGSSSGIHARHAEYYLRRIRMNKMDALSGYLMSVIPELVEDDVTNSTDVVVTIPQKSPDGAIIRSKETALSLFNRAMSYNRNWVTHGHRSGPNRHNVSCTISIKDDEWDSLGEAMWKHRQDYSGISLLPYDGGTYKQMPFEECTSETYEKLLPLVKEIDLKQVKEIEDNTVRTELLACVGGVCSLE